MKYSVLFLLITISISSIAQKKLPIIKANSINVAISDGGFLDKNAWSLSPTTKPDVYVADRASKPKFVTFYTDIDSIKVKVNPGTQFDFVILLNGKDSCFTRIVSSKSIKSTIQNTGNKTDTIPFQLTNKDAIHVKSIVNNTDTLDIHFDLGTLDFRFTKEAFSQIKTKIIDKIQIGNTIWEKPNVLTANKVAHVMAGRFGWRAFDGKILEIDYDKKIMVVHTKVPKSKKDFVKSKIHFIQSLFCIEASIQIANQNYMGNFLYDTGSDLAMVLDSAWIRQQNFPDNQKIIRKSSFSDGAGRKYETTIVSIPQLTINGFKITEIPTSKLGFKSPVGSQINYLGNDLLRRFNCIIDLKTDHIYLKTNSLYNLPFKEEKRNEKI